MSGYKIKNMTPSIKCLDCMYKWKITKLHFVKLAVVSPSQTSLIIFHLCAGFYLIQAECEVIKQC